MVNINKLLKQVAVLLGSNLFAAGANFFSVILLAKYLSANEFGSYVLLLAYVVVTAAFFNPQAWQGYIKYLSFHRRDFSTLTKHVVLYDLTCCLVGGLFAYSFAPVYLNLMSLDASYLPYIQLASIFVVLNQVSTAIGLLRFFEKFKLLALQYVIGSGLFLLAVIYGCLNDGTQVTWFFIANISCLLIGVFFIQAMATFQVLKNNRIADDSELKDDLPLDKKAFWQFNLFTHLTNIVDLPVREFDTILVGSLASVEASGIYKVIKQVGTITTKFTSPITQVIYPELTKALADNAADKVVFIFKKLTKSLFIISIPTSVLLALTMPWWLPLIFNETFLDYQIEFASYLVIHAMAVCMLGIHPIFLALGHVKKLLLITALANIAFVVGCLVLAPNLELLGIIFAILLQYSITILLKWLIVKPQLFVVKAY
ncbi:oligosaccharide flippase family protein [Catenovulum sp. SM1970]|uniref:lipopolysaccharide biosynthesis protein n=1 Tax=Marinifaba aquimaris TaxID=2741323 RepID=UPI0015743E5B|nr:oligosaccharide flippase family protein [Marinifaba aquimaris]NTS76903.1 oligosaccharide flippase family protein [Marinifaba aquimaris]